MMVKLLVFDVGTSISSLVNSHLSRQGLKIAPKSTTLVQVDKRRQQCKQLLCTKDTLSIPNAAQ